MSAREGNKADWKYQPFNPTRGNRLLWFFNVNCKMAQFIMSASLISYSSSKLLSRFQTRVRGRARGRARLQYPVLLIHIAIADGGSGF